MTALLVFATSVQAKDLKATCENDGEYTLSVTDEEIGLCHKKECEVMSLTEIRQQNNPGSGTAEMVIKTLQGMDTVITKIDEQTFLMFWKTNDPDGQDDNLYICTRE